MSVQALSAVLEHSRSRLGDRLVLIAIANHANEHGENAFPRLETLGKEAHLSVRQVIRCVQNLEALGELQVHRSFNKPNVYRIDPDVLSGANLSPSPDNPSITTKPLVPYGSRDISSPDLSRDNLSPLRVVPSNGCSTCGGSRDDGSCWCVAS